jgi:CHAD domain-containing protein
VFVADRPLRQFRELVMRSTRPDTAALARLESSLRDAGASALEESPELFGVLALAPPTAPEPPPADAPGRDHRASAIDAHFEAILTYDPGARLGADREAVHPMRVATRRLRTYLRVARSILDRQRVESLRSELSWLGDRLRVVRDLDVFLGYLRAEATTLARRDRRTLGCMLKRLETDRATAHATLGEALASTRDLALLDQPRELTRHLRHAEREIDLSRFVAREFKRLRRAVGDLGNPPSDQVLHAVRIAGRRARYVAELAEPVVGKPVTRFLRVAKKFQDALGEHQDAVVAEGRLRGLVARAPSPREAFAMGRLAGRQGARRQVAAQAFVMAWPKLRWCGEKGFE